MQSGGVSTFQFVDNSPEAVAQLKLQEIVNNSPQVSQLRAFQDIANNSSQANQAIQLRSMADNHNSQQQQPIQKKASPELSRTENKTGLPDNLKTGMENLSGMSLDDVKVHRNSDKPAQLQAHAYAQGTDIHLGPGQEKHLAHEAWHVVQQKQGRVKPTMQMKGKVNVNDHAGLEEEADVMGAKALGNMNKRKESNIKSIAIPFDSAQRVVNSGEETEPTWTNWAKSMFITPLVNAPGIRKFAQWMGYEEDTADDIAYFSYLIGFPGIKGIVIKKLMYDWEMTSQCLGKIPEEAIEFANLVKELNYSGDSNTTYRHLRAMRSFFSNISLVTSAASLGKMAETPENQDYDNTDAALAWTGFVAGVISVGIGAVLYRNNYRRIVERDEENANPDKEVLELAVKELTEAQDKAYIVINSLSTIETLGALIVEIESPDGRKGITIADFSAELVTFFASPIAISAFSKSEYNKFRNKINELIGLKNSEIVLIQPDRAQDVVIALTEPTNLLQEVSSQLQNAEPIAEEPKAEAKEKNKDEAPNETNLPNIPD